MPTGQEGSLWAPFHQLGQLGGSGDPLGMRNSAGKKADSGKNRVDLISIPVLEELGKVLTFGATVKQYGERNWEKGIKYSRIWGAILRHGFAWWRGENIDPESGLHHLAHMLCEVMFVLHFELVNKNKEEWDDRPL